jgi:hypothetical protein
MIIKKILTVIIVGAVLLCAFTSCNPPGSSGVLDGDWLMDTDVDVAPDPGDGDFDLDYSMEAIGFEIYNGSGT